jgi:cytochrome d ubiquinol oxidase subunit II
MLPGFWFGLIAVLWAGFFLLEGFDFGVGVLLPLVGRTDAERGVAVRAIGPTWDGNEVWLITAGGATFAAFPAWYASMFAGLYIPFALLLTGLIVRGVCIEFRGKVATAQGRLWCDGGIVAGSLLPALLFGIAFADLIRGVKMDAGHNVIGGFFDLVTPFGLLGGLVTLGLFAFHGALFLALRTEGDVRRRARHLAQLLAGPVIAVAAGFLLWSSQLRGGGVSVAVSVVLAVALVVAGIANQRGQEVVAFAGSAVVSLGVPVFVFASLWPDVLPARNNPALSLTVHNASANHYALVVMTVVAVVVTPFVLAYQAWAYWVFRARVGGGAILPQDRIPRATVTATDAYRVAGTAGVAGSPARTGGPAGTDEPGGSVNGSDR